MLSQLSYDQILLEYEKVLKRAKKILHPSCYVCKICNGQACAGRVTNYLEFGAKGNNYGFIHACRALQEINIELDVIHDDFYPDISIEIFGRKFDLPVFASPIAKILTRYSFDSPYFNNNTKYAKELIFGAFDAGGLAWLGDNKEEGYFEGQITHLKEVAGIGVPTIKPWADREEFWKRVKFAKEVDAIAIATDLDAIGLGYQYSSTNINEGVSSRTVDELKVLVEEAEKPVIIKGVMSKIAAQKAAEAGVYGILISNHGGNVVEGSRAPCDVVEEIKNAVGSSMKILVDGGVRSGEDVFKMLALGADMVGIGRPYVLSVYGGGREGVSLYTKKIAIELQNIMRLANCRNIKEITREKLYINRSCL